MRRMLEASVLIWLFLTSATCGWAREPIVYQPEQMRADLEKFEAALIAIHPGIYTHQTPGELRQLVAELRSECDRPLDGLSFYRVVLRLIAGVHDGHTQAYAFGDLGRQVNPQAVLPFRVLVRDERIFVVEDHGSPGIPAGSEILAIEGRPSHEILGILLEHYSADGPSRHGVIHWLGRPYRPFYRLYPEVFGSQRSNAITYRELDGRAIVTAKTKAVSSSVHGTPIEEEAFDYRPHVEEGYAYLLIHRFFADSFDEPENTFPDFYRRVFRDLATKKIPNLVIDLRDNGGGKASNAAYLLQYFLDRAVTPTRRVTTRGDDAYFREAVGVEMDLDEAFGLVPVGDGTYGATRTDVFRGLEPYEPIEDHRFTGGLFVLINGGTASAAGIAAGLLREHTDAVFVGEETYGYAGISNGVRQVSIKGDHTETAIYLPLLHSEYAVDPRVANRGVVPDYPAAPTIRDVLDGRDVALELVIRELLPPRRPEHVDTASAPQGPSED